MHRYHIYFYAVITSITLLASCNTGKKLLEKGNYYEAVMQSVDKLKKNPDSKKARATLSDAYPLATKSQLDRIEKEKAQQSDFVATTSFYVYEDLNRMYEAIMHTPAALEVIKRPKKYYSQLGKVRPKAAEEQYLAGSDQLSGDSRESAKRAYHYFLEADRFVKNYKDTGLKIEQAYDLAILKVLVNLKPVQSRKYNLSADVFYNQVNQTLRNIESNDFIRFFNAKQALNRKLTHPDQYLVINFEDFIVGETHTTERIETVKSDSVIVGQINLKEDKKADVYGIVEAELTTFRIEVVSKGLINLMITHGGFDKRVLTNQDISGQFTWFGEWGNYKGDKRALTEAQLEICNQKKLSPIPPQQMFIEFTKPIHSQLESKLFDFYRGY
jgi:hypothetical protein